MFLLSVNIFQHTYLNLIFVWVNIGDKVTWRVENFEKRQMPNKKQFANRESSLNGFFTHENFLSILTKRFHYLNFLKKNCTWKLINNKFIHDWNTVFIFFISRHPFLCQRILYSVLFYWLYLRHTNHIKAMIHF